MRKLTLGIVGTGGIAQDVHLPILCKLNEFSLEWLCDLNAQRAKSCAERFGIAQQFSSLESCPDVDAILVATPVGSRKRILALAARRGWHAFCEKPFAANRADHQGMLAHAEPGQLVLACGYMRRFYHSTMAARDILRCLEPSSSIEVIASDCQRIRRNPHSSGWYLADSKASGGGFLMETGSHLIDQALTILDSPELEISTAEQVKFNGIDYETTAWGDSREVRLSLAISRLHDLWSGIRVSWGPYRMEVSLYPGAPVLVKNQGTGSQFEVPSQFDPNNDLTNAYVQQLVVFAQRVHSGDSVSNATATGLQTTSLMTQCYECSLHPQRSFA